MLRLDSHEAFPVLEAATAPPYTALKRRHSVAEPRATCAAVATCSAQLETHEPRLPSPAPTPQSSPRLPCAPSSVHEHDSEALEGTGAGIEGHAGLECDTQGDANQEAYTCTCEEQQEVLASHAGAALPVATNVAGIGSHHDYPVIEAAVAPPYTALKQWRSIDELRATRAAVAMRSAQLDNHVPRRPWPAPTPNLSSPLQCAPRFAQDLKGKALKKTSAEVDAGLLESTAQPEAGTGAYEGRQETPALDERVACEAPPPGPVREGGCMRLEAATGKCGEALARAQPFVPAGSRTRADVRGDLSDDAFPVEPHSAQVVPEPAPLELTELLPLPLKACSVVT